MVRPAFAVVVLVALVRVASAARDLPGRMGLYPAQGGAALPMLDSSIDVHVHGPVAEAIVTQTFRNDSDRVTEATYIFPLPADAAVSAMQIETGAQTIRASIETREQAQERYERAVSEGVGAGLLDQERPDVFTQTVSAIPAHASVTVTLRFDTVAHYHAGTWELALPLVVAPRYVPGTASGRPTTGSGRAPDTDRAPDASRVTPGGSPGAGGSTEISIELDGADDATSPTHELTKERGVYRIVDAKSDHDAIVRWHAKAPQAGWVEPDGSGGGFAAVVVEAPAAASHKAPIAAKLVLDHGATSRGDAEAVQKAMLRALLSALDGKDRVSVVGSETLDAAAPDKIWTAIDERWSARHGAFDLAAVLRATRSDVPVVLVTDGLVADDGAVIHAAGAIGAPVHVIGVGPAPNRSLLAAIAAKTGGTVRFATAGDDLTSLARDVRADLESAPQAMAINWGTLAASDVVPATLPRLGAGQAALVLARVKKAQAANARVHGDVFGFVAVTPSKAPEGATSTRGPLARRWAKLALDDLIAAGNAKAITEHALRYGLVSPMTSMVAIGTEVVVRGGVKHSIAVPVSVPAGMQWQHVERAITVDTSSTTDGVKLDKDYHQNLPKPDKKKPARDEESGGEATTAGASAPDAESSEDEAPRIQNAAPMIDNMPPSTAMAESGADGADYDDDGEAVETLAGHRSRLRLALSLGAGISRAAGDTAAVGELAARIERLGPLLLGGELSLWLVDGTHGQGRGLLTFGTSRLGTLRRVELTGGVGATITGDAAGPAFNVTARTRLTHRFSTYLRYDGAVLLHDNTTTGQNAGSIGVEASF